MSRINVAVVVDVVGALSAATVQNGNVCMVDDGSLRSTGQGTIELCTICQPGDLIKWSVLAVDVQTPVAIRNITFAGQPGCDSDPDADQANTGSELDLKVWEGIVPAYLTRGTVYRYRVELQMYEGPNSILAFETPGLMFPL